MRIAPVTPARSMSRRALRLAALALLLPRLLAACGDSGEDEDVARVTTRPSSSTAPTEAARVVARYPHDTAAYTQGLLLSGDTLIEGTGVAGRSALRLVNFRTGALMRSRALPDTVFGEGIAQLGDTLYQITWRSRVGYVADRHTLEIRGAFTYAGEGWGLAADGRALYLSDGSAEIRVLDPARFTVTRTIEVRDGRTPIAGLNELEFVDGELWANLWQTGWIVRVNPTTGAVVGWLDVSALRPPSTAQDIEAVANGIAWDPSAKRLLVTGKRWPVLYEIARPAR